MGNFVNFIFGLAVRIFDIYKAIFRPGDFTVQKVVVRYTSPSDKPALNDFVWLRDKMYWSPGSVHYLSFLEKPRLQWYPENILFRVSYVYGGTKYIYLTKDPYYTWPPNKQAKFKFVTPITHAFTVMGTTAKNVTHKLKKCIGPYNDFWSQENITPGDILDTEEEFDKLVIIDVLKRTYVFAFDEPVKI